MMSTPLEPSGQKTPYLTTSAQPKPKAVPSPCQSMSEIIQLSAEVPSEMGGQRLDQVAAQSRTIAKTLDAASDIPVRIVWKPVLTDRDAIREVALAANADPACVGVITWMHTFSPAKMWISGLDALRKPLLHLHTQANVELPWADIDFDFMNLNQAAHGDREFGYILSRLGRPRKVVVGHAAQAATRAKVGVWARAAAGWDALHRTRLEALPKDTALAFLCHRGGRSAQAGEYLEQARGWDNVINVAGGTTAWVEQGLPHQS